jgi:hypothetical protein
MIWPEQSEARDAREEPFDAPPPLPPEDTGAEESTDLANAPEVENSGDAIPTDPEENLLSPPDLARLHTELETVHASQDAQRERLDRAERDLQEFAETLLNQMAELETRSQQAVKGLEVQSAQILRVLEARVEAAERTGQEAERRMIAAEAQVQEARQQQDLYQQAWSSAPLTLRLKFVRELLPESHALQNGLKEAAALEELRRRGHDLEAWLSNYPALFADAAQALLAETAVADAEKALSETHPAETLATQTLQETREALTTTLHALGIVWIVPRPGEPIQAEHEVIGEEPASYGAGRVARLRRRGFRFQGRLALPAQVVRAAASAGGAAALPPSERGPLTAAPLPTTLREEAAPAVTEPPLPSLTPASAAPGEEDMSGRPASPPQAGQNVSDDTLPQEAAPAATGSSGQQEPGNGGDPPDCLRMLSQRTYGCELPAVSRLAEKVFLLKDLPARIANESEEAACIVLTDTLIPLLPLLGLRYADGLPDIPETWGAVFLEARQPLLDWLGTRLGLALVAPARGDAFDARTMEALETRRTVHAKEDETVARLERIGVVWRARPLIRAQVVRYTTGGIA